MLSALIVLLTYSAVSGVKDAVLWSGLREKAFKWNEHIIFTIERCSIASIPFVLWLFPLQRMTDVLTVCVVWVLCFSFVHNGFYYEARKRIDVPNYHWFYNSRNSTALFEENSFTRTFLFICGVLLLLSYKVFYFAL